MLYECLFYRTFNLGTHSGWVAKKVEFCLDMYHLPLLSICNSFFSFTAKLQFFVRHWHRHRNQMLIFDSLFYQNILQTHFPTQFRPKFQMPPCTILRSTRFYSFFEWKYYRWVYRHYFIERCENVCVFNTFQFVHPDAQPPCICKQCESKLDCVHDFITKLNFSKLKITEYTSQFIDKEGIFPERCFVNVPYGVADFNSETVFKIEVTFFGHSRCSSLNINYSNRILMMLEILQKT